MKKWKLSAGTAAVLGIRRIKTAAPATTAYVMLGEGCKNNCAFCAQARTSSTQAKFLSRVSWLPVEQADAVAAIQDSAMQRVCFQVVSTAEGYSATAEAVQALRDSHVPVAVSTHIATLEQAQKLFELGADRIGLALDVVDPQLYAQLKGGDFFSKWKFICDCARAFPGRITTHLIVGLGETEQQVLEIVAQCVNLDITVALFAFTPLVGTALAERQPPPIDVYRRVQIGHTLLKRGVDLQSLEFVQGRLQAIKVADWQEKIMDGLAFRTSGCSGCNRPYYNERPGQVMYNFPHQPTTEEILQAITESGL